MKQPLIILSLLVSIFSSVSFFGCTKTTTHTDTVTVIDTLKPPVGDTTYKHINDSLWAYYPLNGNLGDSSGNNHTLSLVGSGVSLGYDLWGNPQGALDFTPGSSYAEIADGANFNAPNFTVSLFAMERTVRGLLFSKVDYNNAYGATFNVGSSPTYYIDTLDFSINADPNVCSEIPQSASTYNALNLTESILPYAWYHIVITFSNGVGNLYVNGNLVGTKTVPEQQLAECSNAPFILGNWWAQDNGPSVDGKIDEVRVYSRVLTTNEITYLYKNFYTK